MRALTRLTLLAATLAGLATPAGAVTRPAVIELFTSEGCSSCPPAEAYIGELAQRRDVLALTFHVDYWDELGWRDRFASPAATGRQRSYAQSLRLATIYTPQAVIDGVGDFVGSDRSGIARALGSPRNGIALGITLQDAAVLVDLPGDAAAPPSDVLLVAYQRSAVTPVGRGENAGRTVRETNVVREFHSLGHWSGQPQQFRAATDRLPGDVTDIAVLIQPLNRAPIIGVGTLALRPASKGAT
jgi:hypothetical protein